MCGNSSKTNNTDGHRPFGLEPDEFNKLMMVLSQNANIEEAIIYGSRAKGCHTRFSDIDLTLKGKNLKYSDLFDIEEKIDDLLLPYEMDLSLYSTLRSESLINEIDLTGVSLPIGAFR